MNKVGMKLLVFNYLMKNIYKYTSLVLKVSLATKTHCISIQTQISTVCLPSPITNISITLKYTYIYIRKKTTKTKELFSCRQQTAINKCDGES